MMITPRATITEVFQSLAQVPRRGWVMRDIKEPETTYAHSLDMKLIAEREARQVDPKLDLLYCGEMCMSHDLSDYTAFDVTPHDGISAKYKKRHEAYGMLRLYNATTPRETVTQMMLLRREFEQGKTPSARFCQQLDKLQLAEKTGSYEAAQDKNMPDMWTYADRGITDPHLRKVFAFLKSRRPKDIERRPVTKPISLTAADETKSRREAQARLTPELRIMIAAERESAFAQYPLVTTAKSQLIARLWKGPFARHFV